MGKQSTYFAIKNFFPSKKMGQNFLIDENIAQKIAKLVDKDCFDAIIEVGPGGGILTKFLVLYNKPLIAIELDKRLASTLHNQFRKYQNLEIVNDDVLKIDLIKLAHHYVNPVLLSNLPYSISSPMILKFLKQDKIKTFYCMLQKEMVDRIIAKPGSKGYNAFTVLVSWHATVVSLMNVSPQAFAPPPKVYSNVVEICRNNIPYDERFGRFLKLCFSFKRKTLVNNLKHHFTIERIIDVLNTLNKSANIRAEALIPQELFKLYESLQ